jgi:hypothetical protein
MAFQIQLADKQLQYHDTGVKEHPAVRRGGAPFLARSAERLS